MLKVRSLAILLLLAFALIECGGRSSRTVARPPARPRAPRSPSVASPPRAAETPALSPVVRRNPTPEPAALASLDELAPEPSIRIGLATDARVVQLTSSQPFRVGGPEGSVIVQDVLVSVDTAAGPGDGSFVRYRVQLLSVASREVARAEHSELAEELGEPIELIQEPETARFALRVGSFATRTGAIAYQHELLGRGFESARVVEEVSRGSGARFSPPQPGGLVLRARATDELLFPGGTLRAIPGAKGDWLEVDGRPYRGYLEVSLNDVGGLRVVNVVGFEDYLRGVVPAELSPNAFPEKEALKAQAIAARTYAVKRRGQFSAEGYDLCATPACQVYRGVGVEHDLSDEAVRETTGEILTFRGQPIDALYTSTCGGRTENAENVFSTETPYLVSRACFVESRPALVRVRAATPVGLDAALLASMGIVDESLQALDLEAPAALHEVTRWIDSAMTRLGQEQCPRDTATADSGAGVDTARLAVLLSQSLCWERRLPFLVSSADAERFVPGEGLRDIERRALAQAVREGLIRPQARGLSLGVAMSRAQVLGTLYRLIESRGEPPLREGLVRRVGSGSVALRDEALGDENNEIVSSFSPSVRLYRESNGDVYASESLILLPGDRVRFRTGDRGIEILTLRSEGASFDRSSRFSHWIVRKTSEELSAAVNERHAVGEVLDLRPLRYGRSGRVTELQIVGTAGTEVVRGLAVRRALGIRENLFFADVQRGENGSVTAWIFTGRGWGHGVGMCQVGAYGMAAAGYDYRSILAQYYPGTVIQSVDNAGLTP